VNTQRSAAIYRHLSVLYPRSFRAEYGDDLVAAFTEQLRDERASRVWLSTIRDLVVTIPSQHLEARMNRRPTPQTVAILATGITIAAVVLAVVAGTGPVVGVFLLIAIIALVVATLAWRTARPVSGASRWRTILIIGLVLLATVLVVINVPPLQQQGPSRSRMGSHDAVSGYQRRVDRGRSHNGNRPPTEPPPHECQLTNGRHNLQHTGPRLTQRADLLARTSNE
jgi:hypothetical protein